MLDRTELAAKSGTTGETIDRLVGLGLVEDRDGFAVEDISRVRLLVALETAGLTADKVAAAPVSLDVTGQLMAEPVALCDRTYAEIAIDEGLDVATVERIWEGMGFPPFDVNSQAREDDAELIALGARALEQGLTEEAAVRAFRVFVTNLRRIAEMERELFQFVIEERLLESGLGYAQMLERAAPLRVALAEVAFRVTYLLQRRLLEAEIFTNLTERIEAAMAEAGVEVDRARVLPAMAFVDLTGYTALTSDAGDVIAAEQASRLAELAASNAARHRGQLIKLLGDGVMIHFPDSPSAVAGTLDLAGAIAASDLPLAHCGVANGPMVARDGDYFGTTVNMAARLSSAAEAGEVLVTAEVVDACPEGFVFADAGKRHLRGLPEPVAVFRAARLGG